MGFENFWDRLSCGFGTGMFTNVSFPNYFNNFPINTYSFSSPDSIFTPNSGNYFDVKRFSPIKFDNNQFFYSGMPIASYFGQNPLSYMSMPTYTPYYIPAQNVLEPTKIKSTQTIDKSDEITKSPIPKPEEKTIKPSSAEESYPGSNDPRYVNFVNFIFGAEGGYSDDPDDSGGATMMGVTQGTYDSYRKKKGLELQGVKNITKYEANDIYYNDYYKASGADKIPDAKLALYVFDSTVNMGAKAAKELLSESNNDLDAFERLRRIEYKRISEKNNNKKYLNGWNSRVDKIKEYALHSLPSELDLIA